MVVVLADQLSSTPPDSAHLSARKTHAHADQSAVLASLTGPTPTNVKYFTVGNAFSATMTVDQATALAANPAVASVSPDTTIALAPAAPATTTPAATPVAPNSLFVKPQPAPTPVVTGVPTVPAGICSTNPNKPTLEPEALSTINARSDNPNAKTAAALGIDGTGVKVAIIADGLDPTQAGFIRKDGTSSIVDYQDFYGDGLNAPTSGAEAFGDASTISAQGNVVYDVADFANPKVVNYQGGHCYIKVVGVAPGADVVALKAGSELLPDSSILQAIDYAVTVDHVDVINESFGANIYPDSSTRNGIETFDDDAVAAGVTVTVSSGDSAPTSTIGSPGTDPNVISAGATTDSRIYEQTGYALATAFGNGTWLDNNISALSSAGIAQNGRTIDLSAPGEADWALCDDNGNFSGCVNYAGTGYSNIQEFGGTSQASPMTAGVAALVIQAYRKTHDGNSPTPAVVKQIITSTTRDLGFAGDEQGTGLLDARAAVEAALTYPGSSGNFTGNGRSNNYGHGGNNSNGISSNVVFSTDQLTLEGAPGTTQSGQVQVENVGTKRVTVSPSTRTYVDLSTSTQTTDIDATSTQTTPYPTTGAPWVYKKVTFTVPSGADVLSAAIIWDSGAVAGGDGPVVRMSLFTPSGAYAANTRPQGGSEPANYGENDIRQPEAGTWTAVLYTPQTTGFSGPVTLQAISKRAVPIGSISPSQFSLQPGQSRTVTVSLPTPATGGDAAYTVSIGSSGGHQTAIPVIMRAVVPTSNHGTGIFTGTITGGNARGAPAQTFSYAFDVPQGENDLDVSVSLANDPGYLLEGFLIDPQDETPSIDTNADADGSGTTDLSMTNTVANPAPGRWRYVVVVENPISGNELTENFTGTVAFNTQQVSVSTTKGTQNLIDGGKSTLRFGKSTTATLTVKNTSPAAIAIQTDARTDDQVQVQLAPQFAGNTIPLPIDVDDLADLPGYLVPPDTSRLSVTSSATVPAQMELSSPGGGLDLFGNLAKAQDGSTVSTATDKEYSPEFVGEGFWFPYVDEIGPFGVNGAPAASATLVANATTAGFDPTVTTSTGDPFLTSLDPTADFGTPILIEPGATGTITITIAPTAKKGTTVKGVLNIVTTPSGTALFDTTGDVLLAVPYTYTVGAAAQVPVSSPPASPVVSPLATATASVTPTVTATPTVTPTVSGSPGTTH